MHDPMHVVFEIRKPWGKVRKSHRRPDPNPRRRHRQFGPLNIRAAEHGCPHCDNGKVTDPPPSYHEREHHAGDPCPDCAGRGFNRVPLRRRAYFGWAFWRFGGKEIYLSPLLVLWHVDPETDGSDSSCRNAYKPAYRAAKADNDPLRLWWANWRMRRYGYFHPHHWKVQLPVWQNFNRWAWSRCATCGGRFKWGYSPTSTQWDGDGPHWRKPEKHVHHSECRAGQGVAANAEARA